MTEAATRKVEQARHLLHELGFDRERTNDRSALVLLALLRLRADSEWSAAASPMLGTRAIMDWIAAEYGVDYAPNTRETIRRFTLHQFADAMLVEQNPDQPDRPVNSPKWCYQVHLRALQVVRAFGRTAQPALLAAYLRDAPGLKVRYEAARQMHRIPVTLPDGAPLTLSPGGQNVLIKQMIEGFCSYYTPGGHLLYVGDAEAKRAVFDQSAFAAVGVTVDQHGKIPDLVVHLPARNWLVLLEAASSHGPVDANRQRELAELFSGSTAALVFVSCFSSRAEMRKYLADIAWETEVWCADNPTHLIHFNGERFLGPYAE
ncbi:BsuBI/PstI family type II restriction endonuclease [soil metagenome]